MPNVGLNTALMWFVGLRLCGATGASLVTVRLFVVFFFPSVAFGDFVSLFNPFQCVSTLCVLILPLPPFKKNRSQRNYSSAIFPPSPRRECLITCRSFEHDPLTLTIRTANHAGMTSASFLGPAGNGIVQMARDGS